MPRIYTYIHTEYVLAEMPCVPVIFLFYGIYSVDYNPVFAKKSLIALSVPLKRYIANIRSHKRGEQGGGKSFMPYAPPRTQHTDAAFQVPPVSSSKLFQKQQTLAANPCCFLFFPSTHSNQVQPM